MSQFDKFARNYDQILADSLHESGESLTYYSRYKVKLVRAAAGPHIDSILDFGCGTGRNVGFLRQAFPTARVEGYDISEQSLAVARDAHPDLRFFGASEVAGTHAGYDLVFVSNVLHHVPPLSRPAWFAQLTGLLRPGGEAFIFEHNPFNPVVRRIVRSCPLDADAVLVRPGELETLLRRQGLAVLRQRYTLFFPAKLSRLSFLERGLGWLPLGAQYYVRARRQGESHHA